MLKKEQKDSLVKESSLLEEAKNLEILGPDSLSQITGGIKLNVLDKKCKDKRHADCSIVCYPDHRYSTPTCGH